MDLTIRQAKDSDTTALRELFKTCFGGEMSEAKWQWKYKDSYRGSSSLVALDNDMIIVHYGGVRVDLCSPHRNFIGYAAADVMTHPDWRARHFGKAGAVVRTANEFYRQNHMDFYFGFPSERHGRLMALQLKTLPYRFIQVYQKEINNLPAKSPGLLHKVQTGWNNITPDEMDSMWEQAVQKYEFAITKRHQYILWRFKNNPSRTYTPIMLRARIGGSLKGYAIVSPKEQELQVMDFLCIHGAEALLFSAIERYALRQGLSTVVHWANPEEDAACALRDAAYTRTKGVPYTFRLMDTTIPPGFVMDLYSYRMGDYDAS